MELPTTKIDWLAGTRILLLGHYVPAPLACYFLRHLGAEVVKVEDGQGDHLRHMGKFRQEPDSSRSPMFWTINAGFKSLGLQYRKPACAALLRRVVANVDVIIDGHRAGALERYLGASISAVAPQAIYVPITAYGLVGPMSSLAGHDNNVLALAGNLSYTQTTANGHPSVFSAPVADIMAGQMAAMGVLGALIGRNKLPPSEKESITLDASMLHAGFFLNFLEVSMTNDPHHNLPKADTAWMNGGRADYKTYRCSDGRFVFFGLIERWACKRFFLELGREDLVALFDSPALLAPAIEELFLHRTQAEWTEIGSRHDACITPVNDLNEARAHSQVQALGRVQSVATDTLGQIDVPSYPLGIGPESTPIDASESAPQIGQDNEYVLGGILGMSSPEIQDLYVKELVFKDLASARS